MESKSNLERYRKDLENLIEMGQRLLLDLVKSLFSEEEFKKMNFKTTKPLDFQSYYEEWYSESLEVVRQILPARLKDFVRLYRMDNRKELDASTYTISDNLANIIIQKGDEVMLDGKASTPKFRQQLSILMSARRRFESSLFDIRQLLQADIFDSEIDGARELLKNGYLRAAGIVAGVVLEKHLRQVCVNHDIKITKKKPEINDYNELLKKNEIIQTPKWRNIQCLADTRNLCGHRRKTNPKKEEVRDLIDGVDKIIKTLF